MSFNLVGIGPTSCEAAIGFFFSCLCTVPKGLLEGLFLGLFSRLKEGQNELVLYESSDMRAHADGFELLFSIRLSPVQPAPFVLDRRQTNGEKKFPSRVYATLRVLICSFTV